MKKYKLLKSDRIKVGSRTLYRIKRLRDGRLGGYIETERNLSQEGSAWVLNKALVCGNAQVLGNAQILEGAWVSGDARIAGNARIRNSFDIMVITNPHGFNITFTPQNISIGCQTKTYKEWLRVSYRKVIVFGLCKANFMWYRDLVKLNYKLYLKARSNSACLSG